MSPYKYILVGHEPVPMEDVLEWARWFETSHDLRRVALDTIGEIKVSTVFLAIDYSFGMGKPKLFETIFYTRFGGYSSIRRCSTWAEAEQQHAQALAEARAQVLN